MGVAYRRLAKIEFISLHHSASSRSTTVKQIEEWHKAPPNNFDRVGYNYVITGRGDIHVTRSIDMVPAATRGKNRESIAICITGDNTKPGKVWTQTQVGAFSRLVGRIGTVLGRSLPVYGHGHILGQRTECPGLTTNEVRRLIA